MLFQVILLFAPCRYLGAVNRSSWCNKAEYLCQN
jgi:hypothetical protein